MHDAFGFAMLSLYSTSFSGNLCRGSSNYTRDNSRLCRRDVIEMKDFLTYLLLAVALIAWHQSCAEENRIKVAIVDTGLDLEDPRFKHLICKDGNHYDFVLNTSNIIDRHGHGTHVAGLIQREAGSEGYCFLIYVYYSDRNSGRQNLRNSIAAYKAAVAAGAQFVNYSGGGPEADEGERLVIKSASGTTFVVAAGNEHENIDFPGNEYYPASYNLQNIISVGSIGNDNKRLPTSNYGNTVKAWEYGENVISTLPGGHRGAMSGTSMATAVHTGKLVRAAIHAARKPSRSR